MTKTTSGLPLLALLIFLVPTGVFSHPVKIPSGSQGSTLCKPLPSGIQRYLDEKFDSWKIQEPKDLSGTARERWKSEKPEECPGVAVGRFMGGTMLSYAILLVPKG